MLLVVGVHRRRSGHLHRSCRSGCTLSAARISCHSDDEGHSYRLVDAFGTRSFAFVCSMLEGLADATSDHSENFGHTPGKSNEAAFNAAMAVIAGVQPKDEIEAMLAAHMAVAHVTMFELVMRTRQLIAGYEYQGNGIKRLDVIGNLASKFMRTYALQVEALAKKRRGGEQNVTVTHVYSGGQAVVGTVNHAGGGGQQKMDDKCIDAGQQNQQPEQFRKARQCGARSRSGAPCRAPATKKGRCRFHGGAPGSGAPFGKRNGQYRHGDRSRAAVAERQKFSKILKMLRAGLT
jgi:hypothetical protein